MKQPGKNSIAGGAVADGGKSPVSIVYAELPVYDFAVSDDEAREKSAVETVPEYDLGRPLPLPHHELKFITEQHEQFCRRLSLTLGGLIRAKASAELAGIRMATFEQLSPFREVPAHFTLFKLDPLRGVNIFQITPRLGSCIVDRMMGGPGTATGETPDLGDIEKAVFEQAVTGILREWLGASLQGKAAKMEPLILGYENHGRFVQVATAETMMLQIRINVLAGECAGEINLSLPQSVVEALFRRPRFPKTTVPEKEVPARVVNARKDVEFAPAEVEAPQEVLAAITAEWPALEVTAAQFLGLKVGDVLSIRTLEQPAVRISVENQPKFEGRPGTLAGRWAVEITSPISS
jgi:flagellar motor switch protein FliM